MYSIHQSTDFIFSINYTTNKYDYHIISVDGMIIIFIFDSIFIPWFDLFVILYSNMPVITHTFH